MCPRGRPRGQGRPRGLHLCLTPLQKFAFVRTPFKTIKKNFTPEQKQKTTLTAIITFKTKLF